MARQRIVTYLAGMFTLYTVAGLASYCDYIIPAVPPCPDPNPRDLLFILDGSNSMSKERFFQEQLDYCLSLYCAFDATKPNQAGMIIFNAQIKVFIPLARYSQDQWLEQVETVRATKDTTTPACCSCCTPTAEAFDEAAIELDARGKNLIRIAFVISDGIPSNNNPNTGGNPEWWYYNPGQGFDPAVYNMRIVPERAAALKKSKGNRLFLVGVPDRDGTPPDQQYFNGAYAHNSNQCTRRSFVDFCAKYVRSSSMFPIVSLPVNKNSFSSRSWNVQQLVSQTVGALCELPATFTPSVQPSASPSAAPSTRPSKSPTRRPTSQTPTKVPTRMPTSFPTSLPTTSPSSSSPSSSPSHSPSTSMPSVSPTNKPTSLAPSFPQTIPPTTRRPTSRTPTRSPTIKTGRPTISPTPGPTKIHLDQVDVTFLVDQSKSINDHGMACMQIVRSLPTTVGASKSNSACWELFMYYILAQADSLISVRAGKLKDRSLGWASEHPGERSPAKGLRVNIIGFSCANNQRTPRVFPHTVTMNGGPITSREALVAVLEKLRTSVVPDGGTCPGLAIENAVRQIEATSEDDYPLQTAILMTDGVFYDDPFPTRAVEGLKAYNVLRFAVGIAVANLAYSYGLSPEDIKTQRQQLRAFVGAGNDNLFKDLGTEGWGALPEIAKKIAVDLPEYYFQGVAVPRHTWCGWRRMDSCRADKWRNGNCLWTSKSTTREWACKRKSF